MKKEQKKLIVIVCVLLTYLIMIFGFWNSEKYWIVHFLGVLGVTLTIGMYFFSWLLDWVNKDDDENY